MSWTKNTIRVATLAAGFLAAAAGAANADTTNGDFSLLGGNQVNAPISVPVNLSGNSAALFGYSKAKSANNAHVTNVNDSGGGMTSSGKFSVLGGNQLRAPISVPLNLCGNSLAAASVTKAYCEGSATVTNRNVGHPMTTSGKFSLAGGNQANVPVSVPINACGNAASAFGVAKAACKGGAHVLNAGSGSPMTTSGKFSLAGGNQANVPVSAPINACGNAASAFGVAKAACKASATVTNASRWALPSTARTASTQRHLADDPEMMMSGPDAEQPPAPLAPATKTVRDLVKPLGAQARSETNSGPETTTPQSATKSSNLVDGLPVTLSGLPVLP